MSFFDKLKAGLKRTQDALFGAANTLFGGSRELDDDFFDELEETMIMADVGAGATMEIIDRLRDKIDEDRIKTAAEAKAELKEILAEMIGEGEPLRLGGKPAVILVIGVNGVGKTTSIAKMAHLLKSHGRRVLLAAADTFRAAAIDQLDIWAGRAGVELVKHKEGADPAAVVFDAAQAAKKHADVLIVDTAGRLHNKKNLMDELAKIDRVISRELPNSSRETLLVLDATTGQNAITQAKEFMNSAALTGLIITKLDGSAKGGAIFSVRRELGIPVKFICVGEKIDDLELFDPHQFVAALFNEEYNEVKGDLANALSDEFAVKSEPEETDEPEETYEPDEPDEPEEENEEPAEAPAAERRQFFATAEPADEAAEPEKSDEKTEDDGIDWSFFENPDNVFGGGE
jgi:fused signal recognition particle receptor